MTTLLYKFTYIGSCSKGYLVAKKGGEVSILAFRAGICCKVIFLCLACHILIPHLEPDAFWVYAKLKSDSREEDYVSP